MSRVIPVTSLDPLVLDIEPVVTLLQSNGTLVYPSDTVYGLCCRALSREAVSRVRELKGYGAVPGESRPMIVLSAGPAVAESLSSRLPGDSRELMRRHWPGPLTLVLPASPDCPSWLVAGDGTVAVRVPADPLSRLLLGRLGEPLVSTSANASGGNDPASLGQVPDSILKGCDMALDAGSLPARLPSTVVRPTDAGTELLRRGDIELD